MRKALTVVGVAGATGDGSERRRRSKRWAAAATAALMATGGLLVSADTNGTGGARLLHVVATGGATGGACSETDPCSLQGAVHAAQLTGSGAIQIPAGTYTGTLVIGSSMDLQGAGPGQTILEGTSGGPAVVVDSGTVSLADLTVTGGTGRNEAQGAGGIDNAGTLTLTNVSVTTNIATDDVVGAGGIYNQASATLTMNGGSVTNNTSSGSDTCAGGIANDGTMSLTGVVVSGNTCSGAFVNGVGGIITGATNFANASASSSAGLTLSDTTVSNNSDSPAAFDCSNTGTQNPGRYCFEAAGGLIANSTTNIGRSTFTNNTAVTTGGAIFASAGSPIDITDSTFDGNNGGIAGGAISVDGGSSSTAVSVWDSTFVNNSASGEGGAVYLGSAGSATMSVAASSFVADTAPTGGAIAVDEGYPSGSPTLLIAANLFSNTGCYIVTAGTFHDGGYNVGTDGSCFAATPAAGDVASPAAADLTSLGNFGGQTQTVEPTAGNPAIGAISTTVSGAFSQANGNSFTLCPTNDQRGVASSGACDAGAVQGVYTPPPSAGPTATTVPPTTVPVTTAPPPAVSLSYLVAGADGTITTFNNGAATVASITGPGISLAAPIVGVVAAPGGGHWLVGADGGVFAVGGAPYDGSLPEYGVHPAAPIVGIAAAPGGGYWLAAANGSVYAVNSASSPAYTVSSSISVSAPITGIAAAPGGGYWLVGADGGVFAFAPAQFEGSLPKLGTHVSDITAIGA